MSLPGSEAPKAAPELSRFARQPVTPLRTWRAQRLVGLPLKVVIGAEICHEFRCFGPVWRLVARANKRIAAAVLAMLYNEVVGGMSAAHRGSLKATETIEVIYVRLLHSRCT